MAFNRLCAFFASGLLVQGLVYADAPEGFPMLEEAAQEKKGETEPKKKPKPHFAGVKKPVETVKARTSTKPRSKKVKNAWFSSKTQPKPPRKEVVEEEVIELPEDRPHYQKIRSVLADNSAMLPRGSSVSIEEGEQYPRTGVEAPCGHLFFTGEWLYWRVREEGTEFVTTTPMEFDYSSGFRVGVGVHLPYSPGWDIYANYTDYRPKASAHKEGSFYPLFAYQGAGHSGSFVTAAEASWHLDFQTVDLVFGRGYYLASTFSVHPFLGMKGAWIDQNAHIEYEGGYIPDGEMFTTHLKNDFKGAGPLFGVDMRWHWGVGLSLFGDFSSAFVAGHFDNHQEQHQMGQEVVHFNRGYNLVSPFFQMLIGMGWDRNFNRERSHVGLSVGFETQYFCNQNQTELFTGASLPSYQRQKGDLALYGLTLKGRFDF